MNINTNQILLLRQNYDDLNPCIIKYVEDKGTLSPITLNVIYLFIKYNFSRKIKKNLISLGKLWKI